LVVELDWYLSLNIANIYMALACQEKTSPIDRNMYKKPISVLTHEVLTSNPFVPTFGFKSEVNKEYTAVHMIPTHLEDQRTLQYVDGGVFPAKATPVKPKSSD